MISVKGSSEFPITTDPHNQYHPAIYKDIVVWEDLRNGNADIYGYNLKTQEEFQITTDPADQEDPAIYRNIVVWKDKRDDTYAVYGYNLLTCEEFPIPGVSGSEPVIYENAVICIDMGGDDAAIHGYNLSTCEEFHASLKPGYLHLYPEIHSDIVVWQNNGERNFIYAYDISTRQKFQISSGRRLFFPVHSQDYPAVCDDTIIWTEDFFKFIYGLNLSTGKEILIAVTHMDKCEPSTLRTEVVGSRKPAIYSNIVVWVDCRNGNYDICGYNLLTGEEFFITTNESRQQSPAIYENVVVWEDNRSGNWDIYGTTLVPPLEMTPTKSRTEVVFFQTLITVVALVLTGVNVVLVGWGIWHIKKMRSVSKGTASKRDFRKSNTRILIFFSIGCFYAVCGICYLFLANPFLGPAWLALSAAWLAIFLRDANLPYICITDDEIIIFSPMTFKPKKVKTDAIQDVSAELPDKIQLMLSDGKKTEVRLFFMDERDRSEFLEFLKKFKTDSGLAPE